MCAPPLEQRVKALVAAQAESFGVQAQIDWKPGYAVLVNTPAETAFAREVATELVGAEQVTPQGPPLTGSEDFAFMLERVPGSYLLIGNGTGQGQGEGGCMVHNPGYDFNDQHRHRQRLLGAAGRTLPGAEGSATAAIESNPQESAPATAGATEGANSHERSGPVLHTTIAVWRDFTPVKHRRSKARRA
jgi:hypothetical protein